MSCFFGQEKALYAQNLVPNHTFTQWDTCPYNKGQIYMAQPWYSPNGKTTDFAHRCGQGGFAGVPNNQWGEQEPKAGDGYAGIRLWLDAPNEGPYREYLAVKLQDSLRTGETYFLSFWVNIGETSAYSTDRLGMTLEAGRITGGDVMEKTAIISNPDGYLLRNQTGWEQISGLYEAEGGEDHLVIGNFFQDADMRLIKESEDPAKDPTVYAYIDQVEVEACASRLPDSLIVWQDLSLCQGERLNLSLSVPTAQIQDLQWADGSEAPQRQIDEAGWYQVSAVVNDCPIMDSVEVVPGVAENLSLIGDSLLCPGEQLRLSVVDENTNWQWQDGFSEAERVLREPGVWILETATPSCIRTDSFELKLQILPDFPYPSDTILCQKDRWEIDISVPEATYLWGDGSTLPIQSIETSDLYTVRIETRCFQEILQFVVNTVDCGCEAFVPNVFSPNGDGIQDDFRFQLQPGAIFQRLLVFDRYGRQMHEQVD
ncbi:MAG: hypothetical protein AAF399_06375, partial [Bacteroidota bacterium]